MGPGGAPPGSHVGSLSPAEGGSAEDHAAIGPDHRGRDDRPSPVDLVVLESRRGVSTLDAKEPALSSWGSPTRSTTTRVDVTGETLPSVSNVCPSVTPSTANPTTSTVPLALSVQLVESIWTFPPVYSQAGEFLHPCDKLGENVWSQPDFQPRSRRFRAFLDASRAKWTTLDLSAHGVSLKAWRAFKSATRAIGAAVPVVTERVDRWAVLFGDDPDVDALVRSVAQGAGWQFDPSGVTMTGRNYVKEGFEHKVDALHEEEVRHRRVVPIPPHLAEAVHGVGVVDKDHSNFEKVRVVHNYSEGDDESVNSATDIPEQKWQSAADAMACLRPRYFMVKVDIKSAYRHLPIALQYLRYHTYRWRDEVVADLRFPFGHRAVPGKFHEVTGALVRFLKGQGFSASVGFLDDFWVCCETEALASEALELLQDVLEFLGLEVAWDKCEGPARDLIFLGIRLCTDEFGEGRVSASLPQRKCQALREKAMFFAQTSWCARKDLDRFMGQLAFASRLVRGLSLFCGSGHALLRSRKRWISVTGGACADFRFVAECLEIYNGQQVVLCKRKVKPSHFSVDASTGTGMGGFLDGRYFAVSWPELLALPQEAFYPFRDWASSQINYLELFSVFWALMLWGELLRGLTVVLITDNTPTRGMLEKWRCTPDFRKLLRAIFKQCVQFDVRFIVEWVPSKENQFADALSRKEMRLFFDLHREWKSASIWRQDKDDWKMFSEVFERLDRRFGPFSVDACCDAFGANKQTLVCWTVRQDCTTQDWAGHTAWCNPPFSCILLILKHFLECKRRQNLGTSACFVIPVWPTADFYKFIVSRPSVFIPVDRFEAETNLFSAPELGGDRRFYGPTRWPVMVFRVPPCFVPLD